MRSRSTAILLICASIVAASLAAPQAAALVTNIVGCPITVPESTCVVFGADATALKTELLAAVVAASMPLAYASLFAILFSIYVVTTMGARWLSGPDRPFTTFSLAALLTIPLSLFALISYAAYNEGISMGALEKAAFENTLQRIEQVSKLAVYTDEGSITVAEIWLRKGGYVAFFPYGQQSLVEEPSAPHQIADKEFHCPDDVGPLDGFEFGDGKFGPLPIVETIKRYDDIVAYVDREVADPDSRFLTAVKPEEVEVKTPCGGASYKKLQFADNRCWVETVARAEPGNPVND